VQARPHPIVRKKHPLKDSVTPKDLRRGIRDKKKKDGTTIQTPSYRVDYLVEGLLLEKDIILFKGG